MAFDLAAFQIHVDRMVGSAQPLALGMKFVTADVGVAVMMAPYRDDLVGDPATGVIAGGVVTTLLDHVCGLSVKAADPASGPAATLDLRIDYMRPAAPHRDIIARAHCYRLTHLIAFIRAVAYEDDPADPIATAQGAFVISDPPPAWSSEA